MPENPKTNRQNRRIILAYINAMWEYGTELDMQDALELAEKYNSGDLLLLN